MNNFELEGILTLFYYPNLNEAFEFYKDKVGFEFVADFGYVKIFEVQEGALLGLVDGELGSHRPSPDKPVQIVVMVKDIDSWFRKIRKAGIETREQVPFTGKKMKLKGFHFQDPEGYTIEICQYLTKYGL